MGIRLSWPGVLCLAGTISPFAVFANSISSLGTCYAANAYGAVSPLTCLFVIPFLGIIFCVYLAFSIVFIFDRTRRFVWGGIAALLYGLPLYDLVPNQFFHLSSPCCPQTSLPDWLWFASESIPLVVGMVGGVWGFFSKSQSSSRNAAVAWFVPRLVIAAGLVSMTGFFSLLVASRVSDFFPLGLIFFSGPVLVMICGAALWVGRWKTRGLGLLIALGSVPSLVLSSVLLVVGVESYFPPYLPGLISFLASVLVLILGVRLAKPFLLSRKEVALE